MMTWEVEQMYDEYCYECKQNNTTPLDINTWWEGLE